MTEISEPEESATLNANGNGRIRKSIRFRARVTPATDTAHPRRHSHESRAYLRHTNNSTPLPTTRRRHAPAPTFDHMSRKPCGESGKPDMVAI